MIQTKFYTSLLFLENFKIYNTRRTFVHKVGSNSKGLTLKMLNRPNANPISYQVSLNSFFQPPQLVRHMSHNSMSRYPLPFIVLLKFYIEEFKLIVYHEDLTFLLVWFSTNIFHTLNFSKVWSFDLCKKTLTFLLQSSSMDRKYLLP